MCEVDDLHPTEDVPANMQTTVEVHNEPKATAENSTGPPEDEDYLVPDQDGWDTKWLEQNGVSL